MMEGLRWKVIRVKNIVVAQGYECPVCKVIQQIPICLCCKDKRIKEEHKMTGYCVKCKGKQEIPDGQEVTMKNGRLAMKGKCPICGTGMYRIMGKKKEA